MMFTLKFQTDDYPMLLKLNPLLLSHVGVSFMKVIFLLCWIYRLPHQTQRWLSTQGITETLAYAGLVFMCLAERLTQKNKLTMPSCSATAAPDGDLCAVDLWWSMCCNAFYMKSYYSYAQMCGELYFCNPVVAADQKVKTQRGKKHTTLITLVRVSETALPAWVTGRAKVDGSCAK